MFWILIPSVQFSCSVVSDSLWPHGLQHTRLLWPPPPGVCWNSCPLSYLTISSSASPFSFFLQSFPSIRVFSSESVLCIRWLKYWSFSFSISPSNEYSGLISLRIDWFDLLACSPRDSQESSPAPQFVSINSLALSPLYGPALKVFKPVNPKGNQPWILIGGSDAEAEAPIRWPPDAKSRFIGKDPNTGQDWRQREKRMTEEEMVGWHHQFNGHELGQTLGVGEGQGGLACCSPWGHK